MNQEIQYLPIDSIIVEDFSYDEEFMASLRDSISTQGCHHPLIVQLVAPFIGCDGMEN